MNTQTTRFPKVQLHIDVLCYKCGVSTDHDNVRDHYDGQEMGTTTGLDIGRWSQKCHACDTLTFYDLAKPAR